MIGQQAAKSVSIEKETNLKEYMLMMGLSRTILWSSWFIFYSIISIIGVIIVTIIFCSNLSSNGAILVHSNWFIIFMFLLIWCFSLITAGFLISTLFKTSNVTAAMSILLIFISYFPYFYIGLAANRNQIFENIFSFLSPVAMGKYFSIPTYI